MLHLTLYNGGTCVVLSRFDLVKALESVQKYKCTVRSPSFLLTAPNSC